MLRSFFHLALLARGFSKRILLFGYMELDHSQRTLTPNPTTPLVDWPFFPWNPPNLHVDSSTKYVSKYIKINKIGVSMSLNPLPVESTSQGNRTLMGQMMLDQKLWRQRIEAPIKTGILTIAGGAKAKGRQF